MREKSKWRILLVEDDPGIGEPMEELLMFEGYEVVWVSSGREALRKLDEDELPHMILLDIMMPDMNGWEFREKQLLHSERVADIPVFVLSADRRSEFRVDATKREFFFPKPIDVENLANQMQLKLAEYYSGDSRF
ncbi:MAG: response regulator [Bradymonadales bacterium]|nr:MAG: response regulator [Bradymonadales bacterium]